MQTQKPDLDNPAAIHRMVQIFYARLLDDPVMAPVFLEVAGVHLADHLPIIEGYWCKMLLGHTTYSRNMVKKHEGVDDMAPLTEDHFRLWLHHFEQTLSAHFSGPYTDKARELARTILRNLAYWLAERRKDDADSPA